MVAKGVIFAFVNLVLGMVILFMNRPLWSSENNQDFLRGHVLIARASKNNLVHPASLEVRSPPSDQEISSSGSSQEVSDMIGATQNFSFLRLVEPPRVCLAQGGSEGFNSFTNDGMNNDSDKLPTKSNENKVINIKNCIDRKIDSVRVLEKLSEWSKLTELNRNKKSSLENYQGIASNLIDEITERGWSPNYRARNFFAICDSQGEIYSVGKVTRRLDALELDLLIGSPEKGKEGGGTAAMEYLKAYAKSIGMTKITLEPLLEATGFYQNLGFRSVGRSHPYEPTKMLLEVR